MRVWLQKAEEFKVFTEDNAHTHAHTHAHSPKNAMLTHRYWDVLNFYTTLPVKSGQTGDGKFLNDRLFSSESEETTNPQTHTLTTWSITEVFNKMFGVPTEGVSVRLSGKPCWGNRKSLWQQRTHLSTVWHHQAATLTAFSLNLVRNHSKTEFISYSQSAK